MASPAVSEPEFLAARRMRAAELRDTLAPPTFKGRPGWEFTDISALDLSAFEPAAGNGVAARQPLFALPGADTGAAATLPAGVIVTTIEQAAAEHPELIERHLGSVVPVDDLFVARNGAAFRGGAFVYVPRGVTVAEPISLLAVQSRSGTELDRRTLIVLEEGARAEVWEQYLSASDEIEGVFNAVTELVVGDAANLRYVCGQDLSEKS